MFKQQRVIENMVFEMREPGQEVFKMKEVVKTVPVLWTLDAAARRQEEARREAKIRADEAELNQQAARLEANKNKRNPRIGQ
jgi:hypothetical protein